MSWQLVGPVAGSKRDRRRGRTDAPVGDGLEEQGVAERLGPFAEALVPPFFATALCLSCEREYTCGVCERKDVACVEDVYRVCVSSSSSSSSTHR